MTKTFGFSRGKRYNLTWLVKIGIEGERWEQALF